MLFMDIQIVTSINICLHFNLHFFKYFLNFKCLYLLLRIEDPLLLLLLSRFSRVRLCETP